ncbi:putative IS1 family transposase IS1N [Hollandina sp. SP2]
MIMAVTPVPCPHCGNGTIKKNGTSKNGKQRFLCGNEKCRHKTFVEHYTYNAYEPHIRSRIFFSIVNGSGTRATARTLGIAKDTVTETLRSIEGMVWYVNYDYLNSRQHGDTRVELVRVTEAEMEEIWSLAGDKGHEYRLWWAIDHDTGEPVAFHFGTGEYENLDELLSLLKPFAIPGVYADHNDTYQSQGAHPEVVMGTEKAQRIERKRRSLRTWCSRLVRKGIRVSKDHDMPQIVVALLINFWFLQSIRW